MCVGGGGDGGGGAGLLQVFVISNSCRVKM